MKTPILLNTLLSLLFVLLFSHVSFAQSFTEECGLNEAMLELRNSDPTYAQTERELEDFTKIFLNRKTKNQAKYIIPVVVHIIHENGPENIPAANVLDMLRIVNEDYQRRQADTAQAVAPFNLNIGKLDIEFRLATKDPNGNCTNGITRMYDPAFTNIGQGPRPVVWPQNQYLNIWIVKSIGTGNTAAYSYFPSNNNPNDGVTCLYDGMGSLPPASSNSDARRMPHEIGHYLNLRHPWGPGNGCGDPANCNSDDGITDTPNTLGFCGGCNNSYTTCGTLDNSQNIMDYGNCEMMFTQGQMDWAEAALNSSTGQRNNLWTQANLIATGTDSASYQTPACPPTADFQVNKNKECEGGTFTFTDRSFHAYASTSSFVYNWTFNGGTPASSTLKNPTVNFNSAGIYDILLETSLPGTSSDIRTRTNLIEITPGSGTYVGPFLEQISDPTWPNNTDASLTWTIEKPQGSLFQFQRTVNGFYSSPAGIYLNNFSFNNIGQFNLITPIADLTNMQAGSTFLNFQLAHVQKGNEQEGLSLWISTDCGESFSFNKAWGGNLINTAPSSSSAFIPSDTSEWDFISHDISSLAGLDNIQFRFRFSANGGNNIWLDDIHISDSDQSVPLNVGLRQDLFSEFNLYPNPNEGVFTMEFNVSGNSTVSAEIVDMIGKSTSIDFAETISTGWNTATIDARNYNLKPGVYFLKLESGNQVYSKRLIIR